jgi:hypothetical protein
LPWARRYTAPDTVAIQLSATPIKLVKNEFNPSKSVGKPRVGLNQTLIGKGKSSVGM